MSRRKINIELKKAIFGRMTTTVGQGEFKSTKGIRLERGLPRKLSERSHHRLLNIKNPLQRLWHSNAFVQAELSHSGESKWHNWTGLFQGRCAPQSPAVTGHLSSAPSIIIPLHGEMIELKLLKKTATPLFAAAINHLNRFDGPIFSPTTFQNRRKKLRTEFFSCFKRWFLDEIE